MTKEAILKSTTWDDYGMGTCPIFIDLFGEVIPFIFLQSCEPKPNISDKMVESVNEILSLTKSDRETIKDMLWEECLFSFQVADYGFEPEEGETHLDAHLREFEISNKEDAYSKSVVQEIQISQENDGLTGRYLEIIIDSASDNLINIIVKNGKIIDFDYNGCNLKTFETDEQHAKKNRQKTLQQ